ncbi:cyclodehydratase [Actinocatenispora rupis]|uniref:cyclodehydratase n=1 Tax=Actinocatenispora rupis TaxID=519421 RepID=UPI001EF1DF08|nr:cyclodehydratase [Actinocatenispora rupis]
MRASRGRWRLALGLAVGAVLALVVGVAGPASAATQTVAYQFQASAAGQTGTGTLDQDIDATAPASATAGSAVQVVIDPAPNTVPTDASGYPVKDIKNVKILLPVPANSSYVSATVSGGANLGGTPTVGLDGGNVVLTVPGPIAGGSSFELPTITLDLTAGTSGSIDVRLGGTSYSDPGLTFTADVTVLGIPVAASAVAYPDPNPTLSSTAIG